MPVVTSVLLSILFLPQCSPRYLLEIEVCDVVVTDQGRKNFKLVPEPEDLAEFLSKSPIRYVNNVKAPLLFSCGKKDRRVPLSDAMRYIAALRSRDDAPEVRVTVFPDDNHPLDKPQTMFEDILTGAWWMKKHGVLGDSGE